jgi:hypothetical protein
MIILVAIGYDALWDDAIKAIQGNSLFALETEARGLPDGCKQVSHPITQSHGDDIYM